MACCRYPKNKHSQHSCGTCFYMDKPPNKHPACAKCMKGLACGWQHKRTIVDGRSVEVTDADDLRLA